MSYLPKIEKIANEIIQTLIEDEFFEDFEIEDYSYTKKRFCEELTAKFLLNGLENEDIGIFSEDEFDKILKEIVAEDMLRGLQKKGFINSYEDEGTEEVFFLTEKGREEMQKKSDDETDVLNIFVDDSN
jgi:predicted transcriptional regulator